MGVGLILLKRPPEIDFRQVMCDLGKLYTVAQIADCLNVPWSTAQRWRGGTADPVFENGRALCILYMQVIKQDPPIKVEFSSTSMAANATS